eukprot:s250_g31.t4
MVNDALEGTLSSYSHCLLLIHFLQSIAVLPNLQDTSGIPDAAERAMFGETDLFDGVHDVWFLDPGRLPKSSERWKNWASKSPVGATLRGLLANFFWYLAYEVPAHSDVLSIRLPSRIHKEVYFREMLQRKKALGQDPVEPVLEPLDTAEEHDCELEEKVPEQEEHEEQEVQEEVDAEDLVKELLNEAQHPQGPEPEVPADLSQKYRLSTEQHELQQAMSTRQTLCIDDPMELGRSLGASFQGFERLCYEWRRAYHLLSEGPGDDIQRLRELFCDKPAPPRSIYTLEKQRVFPTLVERADRDSRADRRGDRWSGTSGPSSGSGRSWYPGAYQGKGPNTADLQSTAYPGWRGQKGPRREDVSQARAGKDTRWSTKEGDGKGAKEGKDGKSVAIAMAKGIKGQAEGKAKQLQRVSMDFSSRLSAVHAELAEVRAACANGGGYLGISGSDLASYAEELQEKEQLLRQITNTQVGPLRPPPPGPASTFDRCALPSVSQHLLDYEAVPYEAAKALRALASLAYSEPVEVAKGSCIEQLLRILRLHRDSLEILALRCLCHICFSAEAVRFLPIQILPALLETEKEEGSKLAFEAMARILVAEATERPRLSPELFRAQFQKAQGAQSFKEMLFQSLQGELVPATFLAEQFLASAPVSTGQDGKEEVTALGWLWMLAELLDAKGNRELAEALVCQRSGMVKGIATATTALMDVHRTSRVQCQGIAALAALARFRSGPMAIAEASGTRRVEKALSALGDDASLSCSSISFLVSVLDWPLPTQKLCELDFARIVFLIKQAMQRHLDVVSLQVVALSSLARLLEVLACKADVMAGGAEGLVKAVMARHKDQEQLWTWGRIVLDSLGADRHWTYRQ